jgi:hypothetical protein
MQVEDDGTCTGLCEEQLMASLNTVKRMAEACCCDMTLLQQRKVEILNTFDQRMICELFGIFPLTCTADENPGAATPEREPRWLSREAMASGYLSFPKAKTESRLLCARRLSQHANTPSCAMNSLQD